MTMTTLELCGKSWIGRDGKPHSCNLEKNHAALTCQCSCGVGKWMGKPSPLLRKNKVCHCGLTGVHRCISPRRHR